MFLLDLQSPAVWKIVGLLVKENGDKPQTFPIFAEGWIGEKDLNSEDFDGFIENKLVEGTFYYNKFREAFRKSMSKSDEDFFNYCKGKGIEVVPVPSVSREESRKNSACSVSPKNISLEGFIDAFKRKAKEYEISLPNRIVDIRAMCRELYSLLPEKASSEPRYIEGKGIFVPVANIILDMKDLSEEEMTWVDAREATKKAGKRLFTKQEALIILYYLDEIDRLLKENGGKELKKPNCWFWTKSQIENYNLAWVLNTPDESFERCSTSSSGGFLGLYPRKLSVRAVSDVISR